MKSVAVYLGSALGNDRVFSEAVGEFGRRMAENGIRIVYGGAKVGLMGVLADSALEAGGEVVGVFPKGFAGKREVAARGIDILHPGLTEMRWVKDFAERKQVMEDLSDCAVALPGGAGTMDELFCYAVGNEIARHDKIVYVLNVNGYYDGLEMQIRKMNDSGLLAGASSMVVFCNSVDELLEKFAE